MLPDAPRSPQMLQYIYLYIYIYIYIHNTYIIKYTNSLCPHGFALCHGRERALTSYCNGRERALIYTK
jgi:hypothetical protein